MSLKRTALYDEHVKLGGRLIDFGGWELPVQYSGLADEHAACRTAAALFDVSHMGEILIEGPDALKFVNFAITNDLAKLPVGKAQYSVLCMESGGIVDDIINYKFSDQKIFMVVNASNTDKDFQHLLDVRSKYFPNANFTLKNISAEYSQIALQGPKAVEIARGLTSADLAGLKPFSFLEAAIGGVPCIVGRTGYTGEDGFEFYCAWNRGPDLWQALLKAGAAYGLKPAGLGARDTLRTEVKYPLYGHEITSETNPLEAGLGWVVKFEKGDFLGRQALLKIKDAGLPRKLVGLKLAENDRRIPRQGYRVFDPTGERVVGVVTSGTQAPSLKESIAVAYVTSDLAKEGQKVMIEIRDRKADAFVVPTPFYKRVP